LTFASWGRDTGFFAGYIGGFETFQERVKKLGNFFKVGTITLEDVTPSKEVALNAQYISQQEIPDCWGIKHIGFKPYLIYNPKAQAEAKLLPRAERKEDSDVDSTKLVNSSIESWDHASAEDSDESYL
jgi:hypothetical protein